MVAAATLADRVLAGCPGIRILATSREPLNINGETLWPVGPLGLPPDRAVAPDGWRGVGDGDGRDLKRTVQSGPQRSALVRVGGAVRAAGSGG